LERAHSEDAAALARHFASAGQPGRAARCALQAGLAAKQVYAHVEALQQAGDVDNALVHAREAVVLAEASGRVVDRAVAQRVLARLSSVC
jgi:hypothetical protein